MIEIFDGLMPDGSRSTKGSELVLKGSGQRHYAQKNQEEKYINYSNHCKFKRFYVYVIHVCYFMEKRENFLVQKYYIHNRLEVERHILGICQKLC